MDVTPLVKKGKKIIQSYSGGRFKISGESFEHAVVVIPDDVILWNAASDKGSTDLQADDFSEIIKYAKDYDVFLFGCGAKMAFLSPEIIIHLRQSGVNVDVMDTGAACRTYNVLMAEGRRVLCGLLPA